MTADARLGIAFGFSLALHAGFLLTGIFTSGAPADIPLVRPLQIQFESRLQAKESTSENSHAETSTREAATAPEAVTLNKPVPSNTLSTPPMLLGDLSEIYFASEEIEGGRAANEITLRIVVNQLGQAISIEIVESTASKGIETQVVQAFSKARYAPGVIDGKPVTATMVISARVN